MEPKLAADRLDVALGCALGDEQALRDLSIGEPLGDQ
jgi:hypothetical protein